MAQILRTQNSELDKLKINPVFQMSLSAKELFHSNLLAMFLTLKREPEDAPSFPNLKNLFPPKVSENYEILDILREKENFDLIIIYAQKSKIKKFDNSGFDVLDFNNIEDYFSEENNKADETESKNLKDLLKDLQYVVIENKFKSIPIENQLMEYSDKILRNQNKKSSGIKIFSEKSAAPLSKENTACYLLAPEKSLEIFFGCKAECKWQKDFGVIWQGKSYKEYLENLQEDIKELREDDFLRQLIEKYCEFVESMLKIYNDEVFTRLKNDDGKAFLSTEQENEFRKLRIQDFYEKLSCSYLKYKLEKDLNLEEYNKNENKKFEKFYSKTSYSRGQGFIEFCFEWNSEQDSRITTYLGLQNGELRIYVMVSNGGEPADKKSLSMSDEAAKKLIERISDNVIAEVKNEPKISFKKVKKNEDEIPYSYKTDKYIVKYGKIPLSEYTEKKDTEKKDWREIPYKTLEEKVGMYLEKISETEPKELLQQ